MNCLGKVLEKVYAKRLGYLANTTKILHNTQMGGRTQRSAVDTALLLLQHLQHNKARFGPNTVSSTAFLDVRGAFDHVKKPMLLKVLRQRGLPTAVLQWVDSFCTNRHIQLAFEGQVQPRVPFAVGLPQGSPVSPILFLFYVAEVVAAEGFQLSYIDDFAVTVASTSVRKNCRALERTIQGLLQHAKEKGVEFDPGKTELIHFHNHKKEYSTTIKIAGNTIQPKPTVRWLGLYFDRKLNFKDHVATKIGSAMQAFYGLQRLGNTQTGLSYKALRQLYVVCVTTVADYGVQLWWNAKTTKATVAKFQRLQNQATRRILGAFKTTPSKALELEAAVLPPTVRFDKACESYALRSLKFHHTHPLKKALNKSANTQLQRYTNTLEALLESKPKVEKVDAQWLAPWRPQSPITHYITSKEMEVKAHTSRLTAIHKNNGRAFYTDGSQATVEGTLCNAAAYCEIGPYKEVIQGAAVNLGATVEVADAEVVAVYRALCSVSGERIHSTTLFFFVDSQGAITRIQKGTDYYSQLIWKRARLLVGKGYKIRMHWCPSHSDIYGNEEADFLAKDGLHQPVTEAYTSLSHLKRVAKATVKSNWRE